MTGRATEDGEADRTASQGVRTLLAMRDLILSGELEPGERISELAMVARLGVSRTPVRMALVRLAEEGLLEAIASRGFAVKAFAESEVFEAIEIRGALEGLTVRLAAERGVTPEDLAPVRACLDAIDGILAEPAVSVDGFSAYVDLNARFHALVTGLAGSPLLARQIEKAVALPFASPSAFVAVQSQLPEARTVLTVAQDQHRCVVEAIEAREGARAEAIMREHARLASRNLRFALRSRSTFALIPGAALIRSRADAA
ncbi:GntR family transcriptional regulator [Inquilinus sp. CA228]|uniref:GntR family transcriptional regulator n=1 Tax=Inquilinus sp. CA228 TaxID=3455609 RepID=UPI003F8CFD9C